MNTYKIGNKITCIIRAYTTGEIGSMPINYPNQPYTIIKDVNANLTFDEIDTHVKSRFTQLAYNQNKLASVELSDVLLNDKILNLIFLKSETKLFSRIENYTPEDNILYINAPSEQIVDVFVYSADGKLESHFDVLDEVSGFEVTTETNDNYLVCYQFEGQEAFSVNSPTNQYYTIDMLIEGNEDDANTKMNLHIEKCGLKVDKNMYFNQRSNTVSLIFTVIETDQDYITIN